MTKDIILGIAVGALLIVLALVGTGKLAWNSSAEPGNQLDLQRYIEMHEPTILEL